MRAAIFRDGHIRVDTLPDPVPELGQVLVRTICRGIRGSDPHAAKHTHADLANPERHGKVMVDS
jgi:threonine dehydrogenase-like Zn-dependent dehydrogenase